MDGEERCWLADRVRAAVDEVGPPLLEAYGLDPARYRFEWVADDGVSVRYCCDRLDCPGCAL